MQGFWFDIVQKTREREYKETREILFTASHSFKSSPGGSLTASLRFPLPRVASISFLNWAP